GRVERQARAELGRREHALEVAPDRVAPADAGARDPAVPADRSHGATPRVLGERALGPAEREERERPGDGRGRSSHAPPPAAGECERGAGVLPRAAAIYGGPSGTRCPDVGSEVLELLVRELRDLPAARRLGSRRGRELGTCR